FPYTTLFRSLAAYVLDCSGTTTPAEAMKCCQSIPCSSSGHSQECCETMPQMHAPFVQPSSAHAPSSTLDLIAVLPVCESSLSLNSAAQLVTADFNTLTDTSPPVATPIRI